MALRGLLEVETDKRPDVHEHEEQNQDHEGNHKEVVPAQANRAFRPGSRSLRIVSSPRPPRTHPPRLELVGVEDASKGWRFVPPDEPLAKGVKLLDLPGGEAYVRIRVRAKLEDRIEVRADIDPF